MNDNMKRHLLKRIKDVRKAVFLSKEAIASGRLEPQEIENISWNLSLLQGYIKDRAHTIFRSMKARGVFN